MTDNIAAVTLTIRGAADLQEETLIVIEQWLKKEITELHNKRHDYANTYKANFYTMEATYNDPNLFTGVEMSHA